MLFVHVLARILNFILHTYYIRVSIISSAVQHVPWTLDFRLARSHSCTRGNKSDHHWTVVHNE